MNGISTVRSPIKQPVAVSQKPNQLSVKSRLIMNLDTDAFSTRPMFASLSFAGLRGTRTFV